MRFDMAGEYTQHQQTEQQYRQADANCQRLGGSLALAFVLDQKHHTAGEADNDRGKCRNDENLDQRFLLQVNIRAPSIGDLYGYSDFRLRPVNALRTLRACELAVWISAPDVGQHW